MRTLLIAVNSKYIHTSLGIRSIQSFCKEKGFDIELCEETIQTPLLAALAEITSFNPEIIGIDVHIWNKNYVYSLVSLIRKVCPETIIVLGGPEVSFAAEAVFVECPDVNFIIQGEGEEAFSSLLTDIERDGNVTTESVAWRDAEGSIRNLGNLAVVKDLSLLPFSYDDIEAFSENHKIVYYECTRGCPFRCSYCLSGISHNVRRKPIAKVMQELDLFVAAKAPLIKFVDRTYNLDEDYYLPIMRHLAAKDTEAVFHFEIKADLLSEKVLAFLETVPKGRFQFEIGVQTTNIDTLAAIGRKDDWSSLASNVRKILSFSNIHVHLDLIAGLPFEDMNSFKKSFNDVYSLQPQMLQLGFLKILKGSKISQQCTEYGIVYMNEAPYEVLQTKYIPYKDMRFLKIFEDVFEHTYNTGKFSHALDCIIKNEYAGDAFSFYSALSLWWYKNNLYPEGHNVRNVAFLLKRFFEEAFPARTKDYIEALRFDVFLMQSGWRPESFDWKIDEIKELALNFWRNADTVKKYMPEYDFSTWRKVRKYYAIEEFDWHPAKGNGVNFVALADYTGTEVRYLEIKGTDFYDK